MKRLDVQDGAIVLGIALLGIGAGLVWIPAGCLLVGAVVLGLAIWRM